MRAKVVILVKKAGNHRNKWRALGRKKAASQREQGLSKLLSFPTDTQHALEKITSFLMPTHRVGQCCLLLLHVPTPPSLCTGLLQRVMNIRNHKLDATKLSYFSNFYTFHTQQTKLFTLIANIMTRCELLGKLAMVGGRPLGHVATGKVGGSPWAV